MAEQDALRSFDFSRFGGSGLFLKFEAGKPVTLRVLTTDPVVSQQTYEDKKTSEINISTKFSFIVWNWTEEKAQILSASPAMARKIGELHVDEDFGANIRKIDIKISPTGEKLERRYDIQVLPTTKNLTAEMVKQCQEIDLDAQVKDGGRMSMYEEMQAQSPKTAEMAQGNISDDGDVVIEDIGEEPINLDDIPF